MGHMMTAAMPLLEDVPNELLAPCTCLCVEQLGRPMHVCEVACCAHMIAPVVWVTCRVPDIACERMCLPACACVPACVTSCNKMTTIISQNPFGSIDMAGAAKTMAGPPEDTRHTM